MRKNRIRLTESQLHRTINDSIRHVLWEEKMNRDYEDYKGNRISGKQALIQQGGYRPPKFNNCLAVSNQAKHVYKIVNNFLKTVSHWTNDKDIWNDELYETGRDFLSLLNGCLVNKKDWYLPDY